MEVNIFLNKNISGMWRMYAHAKECINRNSINHIWHHHETVGTI